MKRLEFYEKIVGTYQFGDIKQKCEKNAIDPLMSALNALGKDGNVLKEDLNEELCWVNESLDFGFVTLSSDYGSERALAFRTDVWEIDEVDLLDLAKMVISDLEEWGWVEVDAVHWKFNIGSTFHGIPEEHDMLYSIIGQMDHASIDGESPEFLWLVVSLVDRAS